MSIKSKQNGSKLTCHRNCLPPCQLCGMLIVCTKLELKFLTWLCPRLKLIYVASRLHIFQVFFTIFLSLILWDAPPNSSTLDLKLERQRWLEKFRWNSWYLLSKKYKKKMPLRKKILLRFEQIWLMMLGHKGQFLLQINTKISWFVCISRWQPNIFKYPQNLEWNRKASVTVQ